MRRHRPGRFPSGEFKTAEVTNAARLMVFPHEEPPLIL